MVLPPLTASLPWGSGPGISCNTLPPCLGQWAVVLLRHTAPRPGGSGQWDFCNALLHCLGAVGSGTPAIHCLTARGQRAADLLQCTAPLPGGSGQMNSCNRLPHCLGAVGSGPSAMHCPTAWVQWAVQLLQCTASLPGGSGQWNSCYTLPHCPGATGSGPPAMHCPTALGAVGSGPPAMHCLTAWGQWAVELLQCTAALPGGSGQWTSCNALPHCLGAVGSGPPAIHCLTARGSGQCNSCNALPHCPGAVGSATPAIHCPTALGQWAVDLLQYTAALPGGSGQWTSCNALPHRLGAVGSGTFAAVGTNHYIRVLLSALVYPADMPLQWCAHLWGCLWGIGGCYPSRTPSLVLAPGWWPGGLIPYPKDVGYRYRGVQPDGDRDCFFHIGNRAINFLQYFNHLSSCQTTGRRATSIQGQRGLEPPSPAGPHCPSGTVLPAAHRQASDSGYCRAGGHCLRPPAHVRATGLSGTAVPLRSLSLQQKKKKPEGKALTGPEAPAGGLYPYRQLRK